MSHPLALHGAPQWGVSSAGSGIVFSHSAAPLLPTAVSLVLWNPFRPCPGQIGHERTPSGVHRKENKVMGQGVQVNEKILFSYTCGTFLTQIKCSTCRRTTVQKYHTHRKLGWGCHHGGVTRQGPPEAQAVLPTPNHMAECEGHWTILEFSSLLKDLDSKTACKKTSDSLPIQLSFSGGYGLLSRQISVQKITRLTSPKLEACVR